ncbi:MAG: transporter, partial [Actinomycetia bacterium]|nr:transporter [Actinomycetes bacterium]
MRALSRASRVITGIAAITVVIGFASVGGSAVAATNDHGSVTRTAGVTDHPAIAHPSATPVASPEIYAPPDVVVGEADPSVSLQVTLSAPGKSTVTVGYSIAGETAWGGNTVCGGTDAFVNPGPGTLTFAPGVTSQTVHVTLLNCQVSLPSGFLTFRFVLSGNSSDSTIVRPGTLVDITGDAVASGTPGLYVRDATVDASAGTVSVPVVLGGPSGAAQ